MLEQSTITLNIILEATSAVFILVPFITLVLKKNRSRANRYFILMIADELLLLLNQIAQWVLWSKIISGTIHFSEGTLLGVLYSIDYTLVQLQPFFFFTYIVARGYHYETISPRERRQISAIKGILLTLIVTACCVFTSSIWNHSVFTVYSGGQLATYTNLYAWLLHVGAVSALACLGVVIIRWKSLGTVTSLITILYVISREFVLPIDLLNNTIYSYIFMAIAIQILYFGIDMQQDKRMMEQQVQLAKKAAELENMNTQIMISQIQPHFLYNSLSVIDYLCRKDPAKAHEAITDFSGYLRTNMESLSCHEPIPFEKELEHTMAYCRIEYLRFHDILTMEYDIGVTDFCIPPITLQPLCENAIKHGVRGRENGGTVKISTRREGGVVYITVEDDGIGFNPDAVPKDGKSHIGIENVRKRLQSMVGGQLEIVSEIGKGTIATIKIGEGQ